MTWRAMSARPYSPEDNIMLEVWDVVDKASKRAVSESLTLAHRGEAASGKALLQHFLSST